MKRWQTLLILITIGMILKNKDKIMEHMKSSGPMSLTVVKEKCGKMMEEMETFVRSLSFLSCLPFLLLPKPIGPCTAKSQNYTK